MQKLKPVEEIQPEYFLKKKKPFPDFFICPPGDIFRAVTTAPCLHTPGWSSAIVLQGLLRLLGGSEARCPASWFLWPDIWPLKSHSVPAGQGEADGRGPRSSPWVSALDIPLDSDWLYCRLLACPLSKPWRWSSGFSAASGSFGLVFICHR